MFRTSLSHYINPSAISITPNANNSENDLAVYVAHGTKIKVLSPKAGIGYNNSTFHAWSLSGRNRRLADSNLPYTIYARLSRFDKGSGYLVFAPKQKVGEEWFDKYAYITWDGLERPTNCTVSRDYWYVRLGDVSLPEGGKRVVTFDTGVLGTDRYNTEWIENANDLPLRVELGCTIDDEDAGQTPYVSWNKNLLLTALLMKGWDGVDRERLHHWEILRNTGDPVADAKWPSAARQLEFNNTGAFTISHHRGEDDDFNGAMSAVFTIKAWGTPERDNTDTEETASEDYVVIASTSITIFSEATEKYELALSSTVVNYNPQNDEYRPKEGIQVRIRAVDQRGNVILISNSHLKRERLNVSFAPVDSDVWTPLTFSGGDTDAAEASISTAAFLEQKSLNVQLTRSIGLTSAVTAEAVAELARTTIAFVRDGEDSREREWIFIRSQEAITFGEDGINGHPLPKLISGGEVKPNGPATGNDTNKNQDGWVPQGWWDEQQGVDNDWCYEYGSFRDFVRDGSIGHWGDFSIPRIWNHFGVDGGKPVSCFRWSKNALQPPHYEADKQNPGADWQIDVPNRPEGQGWYLWAISAIKSHNGTYSSWGDPIRMTGDEGEAAVSVDLTPRQIVLIANNSGLVEDYSTAIATISVHKGSDVLVPTSITVRGEQNCVAQADTTSRTVRILQVSQNPATGYSHGSGQVDIEVRVGTQTFTQKITFTVNIHKVVASLKVEQDSILSEVNEVKREADEMKETVSNVIQKADEIELSVKSRKIGGRNLLYDTAFMDATPRVVKDGMLVRDITREFSITQENSLDGDNSLKYDITGATQNTFSGVFYQVPVTSGEYYTLSVYVRSEDIASIDNQSWMELYHKQGAAETYVWGVNIKPTESGKWQRFIRTFHIEGNIDGVKISIFLTQNGKIQFAHPQLERGNIATDWSENPNDIKTSLVKSGINIKDNTLNLSGENIIVDNGQGTPTAMFKDGKMRAELIDVGKLLAGEIDAEYAIINNLTISGFVRKKAFYVTQDNFNEVTIQKTYKGKDAYVIDFMKTGSFIVFDYLPQNGTYILMPSITNNYGRTLGRRHFAKIVPFLEMVGQRVMVVNNTDNNDIYISGCLNGYGTIIDANDANYIQRKNDEYYYYLDKKLLTGSIAGMECEWRATGEGASGPPDVCIYWDFKFWLTTINR